MKSELTINAADELLEIYREIKFRNPAYSLRAFARDLGVSQTLISLIISGKKKLSVKRAVQICLNLKLSKQRTRAFLESVVSNLNPEHTDRIYARLFLQSAGAIGPNNTSSVPCFINLEIDRFRTISDWYHTAILELTATKGFRADYKWVAKQLGISIAEVRAAVARLSRLELLEVSPSSWTKTNALIYFPTTKSEAAVRSHHTQMINKAIDALKQTSDAEFSKREISGITISASSSRIAEAKNKIKKFQEELTEFLSESQGDSLYQLNIQLFPLIKGELK